MTWQQDYINLSSMLFLMGDAYAISNSNPDVVLDLENKKLEPGIPEIKHSSFTDRCHLSKFANLNQDLTPLL